MITLGDLKEGKTPEDVAQWMFDELRRRGVLEQETAAHEIQERFGARFVYTNANGNLAIDKRVLAAFRKLTGDDYVWERGAREWRKRASYDKPGRQQD